MRTTVFTDTHQGVNFYKTAKINAVRALPRPTDEQVQRLSRLRSFSAYRLINFLFLHQGAPTAEISSSIAIGNVADAAMKVRDQLNTEFGLNIVCRMRCIKNRYGEKTRVGTWWLEIVNPALWFGTTAANQQGKEVAL